MSGIGIFKATRRGLMGKVELGPGYMHGINIRARRLRAAIRFRDNRVDQRQQRLPGF